MAHELTPSVAYPIPTITVPDDGDDANAASVQNGFQDCANGIATLAARVGGSTTGLTTEWAYPSAKGRATRVGAVGGAPLPVYVDPGTGFVTPTDTNLWRHHYLVAAGAGPGGRDVVSPTGKVYTGLPLHTYQRPIDRMIMPGGTIVSVEVRVTKGTAQATTTSRMGWALYKINLAGTLTSVATGLANASSGDETIFAVVTEVYDSTQMYYLDVSSSIGADSSHPDFFVGANINWNDPGPRN